MQITMTVQEIHSMHKEMLTHEKEQDYVLSFESKETCIIYTHNETELNNESDC